MPVRISIQTNTKALDGYGALLKSAEKANLKIMTQTVRQHEDRYLQPLRTLNPGPSRHGAGLGAWSTNPAADKRARGWWFVNLKAGKVGGGRTGNLGRQWHFLQSGNRLILQNNSPAAPFVFSFAKVIRPRGGRPNPGHIRTGWPQLAKATAQGTLTQILIDMQNGWHASIAASVKAGQYRIVVP